MLIDDYDLIAGGSLNHPLGPLVEYLPQARDIGLRVIVARRMRRCGPRDDGPDHRSAERSVLQRSGDERQQGGGRTVRRYKAQPMPPGRGMLVSRTVKSGVIQLSRMPDL